MKNYLTLPIYLLCSFFIFSCYQETTNDSQGSTTLIQDHSSLEESTNALFPPTLPNSSLTARTLNKDWNLTSFPIESVTPIATLMQSGGQYSNIVSIWSWNASLNDWAVYPKTSSFTLLTEVTPDMG